MTVQGEAAIDYWTAKARANEATCTAIRNYLILCEINGQGPDSLDILDILDGAQ